MGLRRSPDALRQTCRGASAGRALAGLEEYWKHARLQGASGESFPLAVLRTDAGMSCGFCPRGVGSIS